MSALPRKLQGEAGNAEQCRDCAAKDGGFRRDRYRVAAWDRQIVGLPLDRRSPPRAAAEVTVGKPLSFGGAATLFSSLPNELLRQSKRGLSSRHFGQLVFLLGNPIQGVLKSVPAGHPLGSSRGPAPSDLHFP